MPSGRPYITQSSVTAALDTLIYPSKTSEPNSLEHLLLVDLLLADPDLPSGELTRQLVLHNVMVDLIVQEFGTRCTVLQMPVPTAQETREKAAQVIRFASLLRNAEYLLWMLLYYRYVRTDLGFGQDDFSELLSLNSRSLRRYFNYALRLLTRRLIQAEWNARLEHHRALLYAKLPHSSPPKLIGRETLLNDLWTQLPTLEPRHLYVTGAPGCGKTSLVEVLAHRIVSTENIAHLVWLSSAPSCEYVLQYITQEILEDTPSLSLRSYLQRQRLVLVLDDAEALLREQERLTALLLELSAAVVFLTTSFYSPLTEISVHVPLPELDQNATVALVRALLSTRESDIPWEDAAAWIYHTIGGNPLEIKRAASMMAYSEDTDVRIFAREDTVGRAFDRQTSQIQMCWCALALIPPSGATLSELETLWPEHVNAPSVGTLMRLYFVERDAGRYRLTVGADDYIRQRYKRDASVRANFSHLLDTLMSRGDVALPVVEHLLMTESPYLTTRIECAAAYCWSGLQRAHFAQWLHILESMKAELSPELLVAYGVCLRRVGNWSRAELTFRDCVEISGVNGLFDIQVLALLEWATLARLRGDYQRANNLLEMARTPNLMAEVRLLQRLWFEETQIALDRGDGAAALDKLSQLPVTVLTLVFASEAYFVLQDYTECQAQAERALDYHHDDPRVEASLYSLIGRSFQAEGNLDAAESNLSIALTILEASDDTNALARARANLAAILLELGRVREANELLQQAMPALSLLGDQVGRAVTLHNQRLTAIYISR